MKTSILKTTLLACTATAAIIGCKSGTEQKTQVVEMMSANVVEVKQTLPQTDWNPPAYYTNYKEAVEIKLNENDHKIADLKLKMNAEDKETHDRYERQLDIFDHKNILLKKIILQYKGDNKEKWELFKQTFKQGIDELDKSMAAMVENYVRAER